MIYAEPMIYTERTTLWYILGICSSIFTVWNINWHHLSCPVNSPPSGAEKSTSLSLWLIDIDADGVVERDNLYEDVDVDVDGGVAVAM